MDLSQAWNEALQAFLPGTGAPGGSAYTPPAQEPIAENYLRELADAAIQRRAQRMLFHATLPGLLIPSLQLSVPSEGISLGAILPAHRMPPIRPHIPHPLDVLQHVVGSHFTGEGVPGSYYGGS